MRSEPRHAQTLDHWPELQIILNVLPNGWRLGWHWDWATTRTITLDAGPITVTLWAHDPDESTKLAAYLRGDSR